MKEIDPHSTFLPRSDLDREPEEKRTRGPSADARAMDFNERYPVGQLVNYWRGVREGPGKRSVTVTPASVLGGGTAVVWVKGEIGCIALSHIEPVA